MVDGDKGLDILENQTDEDQLEELEEEEEHELEESQEGEEEESGEDEVAEPEESDESEEGEESKEEPEKAESDDIVLEVEDDEEEFKKAPGWVKRLRKDNRRLQKELREQKEAARAAAAPEDEAPQLPKKPTLEQFDYDEEKYADAVENYAYEKKRIESERAEAFSRQQEQARTWQEKVDAYNDRKANLNVSDYDEAENAVKESLNGTQQSIILEGAKDPALLVLALGRDKKLLEELAKIGNPVQLAFKLANLEQKIKVKSGATSKPKPERKPSGKGRVSPTGISQSALDKAREKADKTGDMTEVLRIKRLLRAQQS